MAKRVEIEVEVSATGEVSLAVKGMKGKGCVDLVKPLEEALGEVTERKLTADYHVTEKALQTRKNR